jgi:hypothetical protein
MIVDLRQLPLVGLALAVACTFGSPGGEGNGGSNVGTADDGDDDGASSSVPGDDGMAATGGASSGTSASGPTDDGSPTTAPVDPDGSDGSTSMTPSSSDDGEPPTTGSDGPVDPTTSGPPSTEDDGGSGVGYPACPSGEDSECGDGNNCVPVLDQWDDIVETVCGEGGCSTGADCDPPSSGNAVPVCVELSIDTCMLDCDGGATCPDGMQCSSTTLGNVCVWD